MFKLSVGSISGVGFLLSLCIGNFPIFIMSTLILSVILSMDGHNDKCIYDNLDFTNHDD